MNTNAVIFHLDETAKSVQKKRTPEVEPYHIRLASDSLPRGAQIVATINHAEFNHVNPEYPIFEDHISAARNWLAATQDSVSSETLRSMLRRQHIAIGAELDSMNSELRRIVLKANIEILRVVQDAWSHHGEHVVGALSSITEESIQTTEGAETLAALPLWGAVWAHRTATTPKLRSAIEQNLVARATVNALLGA